MAFHCIIVLLMPNLASGLKFKAWAFSCLENEQHLPLVTRVDLRMQLHVFAGSGSMCVEARLFSVVLYT